MKYAKYILYIALRKEKNLSYFNEEDFYEPSEGELFFDEMKEKFREILREDVNSELSRLTKENAELRKTVKEYNDKKMELSRRERDIQYKEDNLRRDVEKEFYNKTIEEVFEHLLEDSEVWYAEHIPHEKPKCNLCNEERELVATYPNGEIVKKQCDCARPIYVYEPMISVNKQIKFHKAYKPRYSDHKKCYFTKNYRPNKDYAEAYDCYSEFRIENIFDEFNDDVKEYHETKRYGEKVAFRNKEACQKYCDWLNEKQKEQ